MALNKISIFKTLCYSDIFDYPLTKEEIYRYLILDIRYKKTEFEKTLANLLKEKRIEFKDSYYFLRGREEIVNIRKLRTEISHKKMFIAQKICRILSSIPTVEFIGISGSLAVLNAKENADIDLFIIVKKNSLWITRLLVLIILQMNGVRRKRNIKKEKDRVCINMIIDSEHLEFSKNRQDIYTAHEIVQMKSIFSRGKVYENFLKANNWTKSFLPNAYEDIRASILDIRDKPNSSMFTNIQYLISNIFISVFEPLARVLQLWYMKNHITNETIKDGFIAFHPFDYRIKVLKEWKDRIKAYEI